ncbi:MAG: RedB protein [Planctomycetota bacterium]|nr:RedB protein [Planctomycetota bacterium]
MNASRSKQIIAVACAVWVLAVAGGMGALSRYQFTPGAAAFPESDWPTDSSLLLATDRFSLLVFVHPECPCSRATLSELNRLLARCTNNVATTVVFVASVNGLQAVQSTALWNIAGISGVKRITDIGGVEAKRFDAATSGQAYLYSPRGKLLFQGGITDSRGHEGDNAGSDAIVNLVQGKPAREEKSPVFGCPLRAPTRNDTNTTGTTCKPVNREPL